MPVKTAKNHYLGLSEHKRMNCAQSVIAAFKDKFDLKDEEIEEFKHFGGGKAPEGLCGAFYASKYILKQFHIEKEIEFEKYFVKLSGSNKCREIRQRKIFSCLDCVEKSAEYLSGICEKRSANRSVTAAL